MINTPKFWYKKDIISLIYSVLLFPLSLLWILIYNIKKTISFPYKSYLKVICVGNITVGGTGKTPLSVSIFKWLKELGFKPIFLIGGYKAKISGPIIVKLNQKDNIFGDEGLILAKVGPTVISKNRFLGIKYIENLKKEYDVVLMDDGLQNHQIFKNINLLAIDRKLLFGNKFCLPAGPLRETINSCMRRIDAIIFTGNKSQNKTKFNITAFDTFIFAKKNKYPLQRYFAFCGIANPEKFFETLKLMNFNIVNFRCFPDHYKYNENDIINLIQHASQSKSQLITTEKDLVKINVKFHKFINILPIEIKMSDSELKKFKLFINNQINV